MFDLVSILIVDDNAIMVEGYKHIFSLSDQHNNLLIKNVTRYEDAFHSILRNSFDIIIIDLVVFPFIEYPFRWENMTAFTKSKILIITSHTDSFTLFDTVKKINPKGLLAKNDLTPDILLSAFDDVLKGKTYYSTHVKKCLKMLYEHPVFIDDYNRRIIILLSRGIKTKNLPQHLNLSISAIDKRKAQIKEIFDIEKGTDEDIIREAKNNGFI